MQLLNAVRAGLLAAWVIVLFGTMLAPRAVAAPADWRDFFVDDTDMHYFYDASSISRQGQTTSVRVYEKVPFWGQSVVYTFEINCNARTLRRLHVEYYDWNSNAFDRQNDLDEDSYQANPNKLSGDLVKAVCGR